MCRNELSVGGLKSVLEKKKNNGGCEQHSVMRNQGMVWNSGIASWEVLEVVPRNS